MLGQDLRWFSGGL